MGAWSARTLSDVTDSALTDELNTFGEFPPWTHNLVVFLGKYANGLHDLNATQLRELLFHVRHVLDWNTEFGPPLRDRRGGWPATLIGLAMLGAEARMLLQTDRPLTARHLAVLAGHSCVETVYTHARKGELYLADGGFACDQCWKYLHARSAELVVRLKHNTEAVAK